MPSLQTTELPLVPAYEPWTNFPIAEHAPALHPLPSNYSPLATEAASAANSQPSYLEPPHVASHNSSQQQTPKSSSVSEKAEASVSPSSSQRSQSPHRRVGAGGRRRGERLSEPQRQATSRMRRLGACWRCALQRGKSSYSLKTVDARAHVGHRSSTSRPHFSTDGQALTFSCSAMKDQSASDVHSRHSEGAMLLSSAVIGGI